MSATVAEEPRTTEQTEAVVTSGSPDRKIRWEPLALVALLVAASVLYLWDLEASGWANTYYSAAVQAGTKSWMAFLFGSFDSSNFITVDKIPGALWPMELSAAVFGVSSWSILIPQALMGTASVGILYAAVRRWHSAAAGLIAGSVLTFTPVAALMFRFNNPDALLVLLLTSAAYALVRAIESGKTKWILAVGALIGLGFLAKMLQAFLVVPVFGLAYLVAGPLQWRRRVLQLIGAAFAMVIAGGWWVALVALWPQSARPYIGGSQNNSIFNLMFGYNGFGRLTGNEAGSVGGMGANGTGRMWGETGITRMFNSEMGGQISWLLPAALMLIAVALVFTWRRHRTDRLRASTVIWGGWLVVTVAVFSFGAGIIHPYYTVALAPAVSAIVGIGAVALWRQRSQLWSRVVLAICVAATSVWTFELLSRSAEWLPWLRQIVLTLGLIATAALLVPPRSYSKKLSMALAVGTLAIMLAAPASYAVETALTPHSGALPSAGPATAGGFGPGGGRGFGGGMPPGGFGGGGGMGGLLQGSRSSAGLTALLKDGASKYEWVAATARANQAAGYQLGANEPVMAIGGFNGTDPAPTLAQFKMYANQGNVHYFIAGNERGFGSNQSSAAANEIEEWVTTHFVAKTVDNVTVYDLSSGVTQQ